MLFSFLFFSLGVGAVGGVNLSGIINFYYNTLIFTEFIELKTPI